MSWSVLAVGTPAAAAASIEKQFAQQSPCSEPEESVRQSARGLIAAALAAQDPGGAVKANGFGSQSVWTDTGGVKHATNSLKIEVEPISGFLS